MLQKVEKKQKLYNLFTVESNIPQKRSIKKYIRSSLSPKNISEVVLAQYALGTLIHTKEMNV